MKWKSRIFLFVVVFSISMAFLLFSTYIGSRYEQCGCLGCSEAELEEACKEKVPASMDSIKDNIKSAVLLGTLLSLVIASSVVIVVDTILFLKRRNKPTA